MLNFQIYPEESQLTAMEKLVSVTEKALKAVSDSLAEEYVFSSALLILLDANRVGFVDRFFLASMISYR